MTDENVCFHCAAPIPRGVVIVEPGSDEERAFCCHGCHGAYLLICGAGLDAFYRRRQRQDTGLGADAFRESFDDAYLTRFVTAGAQASSLDIIVEGIRCASCVWLVERMLERMEGVLKARVNYATGRARVDFDPAGTGPAALFQRISLLGYRPRPYTRSEAQASVERQKRDLMLRFGTAFFLTMQLMAYSFGLYAGYFQGMSADMKLYLQLFSLLVTTPVIFYSGWPFLAGAWRGLVNRAPNMELLVALGALSSYGYSLYATCTGGEVYYETAAMIVTLILFGRLLENAAKRRAAGGVERLLGLTAGRATRLTGDATETVDVSELAAGDLILVGPGERFPVDGTIAQGSTDVDESPATGESIPQPKGPGQAVIAGSTNLTGTVRIRCERAAADSFIARVARLVEEAQSRRAPIQGLADRVSGYFVPAVLLLSAATFLCRLATGAPPGAALMTALAVLVIACPCALGLATPTAILAGTGAAAAAGVIFKGGDILERLSRISVAVFDKTGTLTCGEPAVVGIEPAAGQSAELLLSCAAAVETGSRHPVGRALVQAAHGRELAVPQATELRTTPGAGITGTVGRERIDLGSLRFLQGLGVGQLPAAEDLPAGLTTVLVARNLDFAGVISLSDRLREEAGLPVAYFARQGIASVLLSGDRTAVARQVAAALEIPEACGEATPAAKTAYLAELRQRGETVLMVGDGINDAPALSEADVGCAVAGGTDIAIETSDLVLAQPDLKRLVLAHQVARRTMSVVRQNLAWAFIYNLVGIPLAMTGKLTPIYAAAAMALSSLCVVGNSLRIAVKKHG